jgi:glycine/D-amino acid oxidase-like deaminating enzyme
MMELAIEKGAKIVLGTARRVRYAEDGRRVVGVEYSSKGEADDEETKVMDATDVIVAAGPWTSSTLLPTPIPQSPVRAHSICVRPSRPVSAFALFTSIQLPSTLDPQSVLGPPQKRTKKQLGGTRIVNPEIYARPNNEIYICTGDAPQGVPFPPSTAQVQVDESVCDDLFAQVSAISREIRDGQVLAKQACYLPTLDVGPRGCPVVGRVGERIGLYVATGHTCWGICNAPGTARALSELVMDGEVLCADLKRLEYRNFV